jgi:hypothetical protein
VRHNVRLIYWFSCWWCALTSEWSLTCLWLWLYVIEFSGRGTFLFVRAKFVLIHIKDDRNFILGSIFLGYSINLEKKNLYIFEIGWSMNYYDYQLYSFYHIFKRSYATILLIIDEKKKLYVLKSQKNRILK